MTEKERMINGQLYRANDDQLRADMKRARVLTRLFNQTTEEQQTYRRELTQELFAKSGADLYIEPPFRTDYGCQTTIGEHVYMNYDCIIIDVAPVTIGNHVFFGPRVGLKDFKTKCGNEVQQFTLLFKFVLGKVMFMLPD